MTEPPSEPPPEPESEPLPGWIPILIGAALAALALYTGLRYRQNNLVTVVRPRRTATTPNALAPPGEPEAGASLLIDGNAPPANPPVAPGKSRAVVTGTGNAIQSNVLVRARRGMTTAVVPDDAIVYVNDVPVGQAKQFTGQPYEFASAGSYTVRIAAPGFRDRVFTVTVAGNVENEIARIEAKLQGTGDRP
jgi:PEGA domain-containing protein